MSPLLPSRPAGRVRLLVLGLLLAVAGLLVAPSGAAAAADPAATADRLTRSLGAQGAGAYLDTSGRLTVNVLNAGAAAQVRAAGAELPGAVVVGGRPVDGPLLYVCISPRHHPSPLRLLPHCRSDHVAGSADGVFDRVVTCLQHVGDRAVFAALGVDPLLKREILQVQVGVLPQDAVVAGLFQRAGALVFPAP